MMQDTSWHSQVSKAGVKIEDTASPTSQWIRIADAEGKGFAEAYPTASEFNPDSINTILQATKWPI